MRACVHACRQMFPAQFPRLPGLSATDGPDSGLQTGRLAILADSDYKQRAATGYQAVSPLACRRWRQAADVSAAGCWRRQALTGRDVARRGARGRQ